MVYNIPKYVLGGITRCVYVTVNHKTTCYFPDGKVYYYSGSVEDQISGSLPGLYEEIDEETAQELLIKYAL